MNAMRQIKSIASGRSSVSDPASHHSAKRENLESNFVNVIGMHPVDRCTGLDEQMASTSLEDASVSTGIGAIDRSSKADYDKPPKQICTKSIAEDIEGNLDYKDMEAAFVSAAGTETGQIITTRVNGQNGLPKQTISYMAERVVGTGSFGTVFQAKCLENGEQVAIKKVLQDKRYKNRELQIMRLLDHPYVVQLKHFFSSQQLKRTSYTSIIFLQECISLRETGDLLKFYVREPVIVQTSR